MDRSYLSDQRVVEASREFVCARLISFEDADEAKLMQLLWSGSKVNTIFALMDPSGARRLSRVGRSPKGVFDDAAAMAAEMRRIATRYPAKKGADAGLALPVLEDVRIALNVTECDAQQLVILRGSASETARLEKELAKLAWSDEFVGRFLYVRGGDETDWSVLAGIADAPEHGLVIVRSTEYGLTGEVVASLSSERARGRQLAQALRDASKAHRPTPVDTRRVRRQGRRAGVRWQPELPLPDRR